MTTAHPYAPALELATEGIVPYGTPLPSKADAPAPVGSGPFQMADFRRDESATLVRNSYHPYPRAAPRTMLFKVVPDPTVRALELAEGVCDFAGNNIQPEGVPWLAAHSALEINN